MSANAKPEPRIAAAPGATTALVLLTSLNFVNYIDRYVLAGVQEQIKSEFQVSDAALGSLTFWFLMTYMATSPMTGWLGDRFPRKPMIVIAALFWSSINLVTAFAHTFASLNLRHAALGLGEASFGIFATAMLADFYPPDERNRVLTIFNVAIPVGAALGFVVGGSVAQRYGWRMSFTVSAVPGILIALLIAWRMREPERGSVEDANRSFGWRTVAGLARNPRYVCAVLGNAAVTFVAGGLASWMPSFLHRVDGRSLGSAGFIMGVITVAGGLLGTAIGGVIAQRWSRSNPSALYLVPAWGSALAFAPAMVCFFSPRLFHTNAFIVPALAAAIFFIFLGNGPVNAATVNAVSPAVRATALAGQLLFIHALGDALSPTVIGAVSDHSNLADGLGSTLLMLCVGSALFFLGARFASGEHKRMLATR